MGCCGFGGNSEQTAQDRGGRAATPSAQQQQQQEAQQHQPGHRQSDLTHGKVWPGTYNLGRDNEAIVPAADAWERDPRTQSRKTLLSVQAMDGSVTLTCSGKLGTGAQGGVWKCEDVTTRKTVAVKTFDKHVLAEEQKNNCLRNPAIWHEFQLLKRVGAHKYIVECDGRVLESETHFFVPMEYVDGIDLHRRLFPSSRSQHPHQNIPLDPRAVYRSVMEALAFCHEHKAAHRDLKPTNVMLTPDPEDPDGAPIVKLMDFGLGAEIPEYEGKPVRMRRPVGTTAWCAPEVLAIHSRLQKEGGLGPGGKAGTSWQDEQGLGYFARPADVWSSGVMLWELMTHDHLFHRPRVRDAYERGRKELLMVRRWKQMPDSLEAQQFPLWDKIEHGAQELLIKILDPEPTKRPMAQAIADDIWLSNTSPRVLAAPAQSPPVSPHPGSPPFSPPR